MGCDIHVWIEYKLWARDDDQYRGAIGPIWFARDYTLFELMAGVRGVVENAVVSPRGLPDLLSDEVLEARRMADGPHTESWLDWDEVVQVWTRLKDRHDDLAIVMAIMDLLKEQERDPRLVFWFDN